MTAVSLNIKAKIKKIIEEQKNHVLDFDEDRTDIKHKKDNAQNINQNMSAKVPIHPLTNTTEGISTLNNAAKKAT